MSGAIRIVANILASRVLRLGCVVVGVLLANQVWAGSCQLGRYGTLPVEIQGWRATTVVKINGTDTRFALDTGAFFNIMSNATASSLGLKLKGLSFGFRLSGVGGSSDAKYTRVKDFGFLDTELKDIDFIVAGSDAGYGLLGANLLDFADLEIDMANGKVTLYQVHGCDKASLAYWASGLNYFIADLQPSHSRADRRTFLTVTINGKKFLALIDSGAPATVLTRQAAERAGIDLQAPGVRSAPSVSGFGAKRVKSWIVPIDSFSVGTETIQHSQMEVIDGTLGDERTDILLGLDYLLAHHMFIANSLHKAFFTYNGGRVFAYGQAQNDSDKPDGNTATGSSKEAPKAASDYALRGEADFTRGETQAAIADLNEAIRLSPDQADYYAARARALWADKQSDAALDDLNKSLSLDSKNLDALLLRANVYYARHDRTSAAADIAVASTLAPDGSPQARRIADMYILLDQPAAALPLLDGWIRLHKNDVTLGVALNERCWARGLINQALGDALDDCLKAIKRDGQNPAYLDSLGLVQLRLGHYADSIKAYQQAVMYRPRSAWSHFGLGLAEIRNGQTDAGKADLRAARALDPTIEAHAGKFGLTASGQPLPVSTASPQSR